MLEYMPKKGAKVLYKLVKSAAANAVHNDKMELDTLVIDRIYVGRGPKIKRVDLFLDQELVIMRNIDLM